MMLINSDGIIIRINVSDISTTSRNAMGVTLMKTGEDVNIVAIAKINYVDAKDEEIELEESKSLINDGSDVALELENDEEFEDDDVMEEDLEEELEEVKELEDEI
ncbi:DNA gyrase subunit A [bioreactor metagenome]|uniref:DNA gyrase subunit A n=1 Tax=bioreactor metagenome TaxID=1076179 RepID=A0A645G9D5_9ZZZZ